MRSGSTCIPLLLSCDKSVLHSSISSYNSIRIPQRLWWQPPPVHGVLPRFYHTHNDTICPIACRAPFSRDSLVDFSINRSHAPLETPPTKFTVHPDAVQYTLHYRHTHTASSQSHFPRFGDSRTNGYFSQVSACSVSQEVSVIDFSTDYCNVWNL
jgi:hypothetical protein